MSNVTVARLESIIDLHEKMKGAYFFTPPYNAAGRRAYENRNSLTTEFEYDGQEVKVEQETTCSCKNVYYRMTIQIDGEDTKKNIRFIKKILAALEKAAA